MRMIAALLLACSSTLAAAAPNPVAQPTRLDPAWQARTKALLEQAWAMGARRVWVHTCSLDHPAALPSYLRAGFVAKRRAFESFPDPRLAGLLPESAAPQVPLIS